MKKSDNTVPEIIVLTLPYADEFLLYLQSNNYSDETIYNYERDLAVFEDFLKEISCPLGNVSKRILEQYKAYLTSIDRRTARKKKATQKLKSYSINRNLSSVRAFFKYLNKMDLNSPVPPDSISLIKTEKKVPKVPEFEQIVKLIEFPSMFEKDILVAKRNRAMLEALFATGMRISELVNLTIRQIAPDGQIYIVGKGKKERFVYLTSRAYKRVREYLKTRSDDNPYVFIPYRGKNIPLAGAKHISPNYVQIKIKQYRELLGINVPTSPHSLRHAFATYLAEAGASPAAIQVILGHESLDTTTRYVHASHRYARKVQEKFHPLKE